MTNAKKFKIDYLVNINWDDFNPSSLKYNTYVLESINYTRTELNINHLRSEALEWIKKHDQKNYTKLKLLPEWRWFSVGKYYWMMNRGAVLGPDTVSWINNTINELINESELIIDDIEKSSLEDTIISNKQVSPENMGIFLAQNLEDYILDGTLNINEDAAYELLKTNEYKPAVLRAAKDKIQQFIYEMSDLSDEEVEDGFSSKEEWSKILKLYRIIEKSIDTYSQNSKRTRKAKNGPKNKIGVESRINKKVENVQYKKEDSDLKLVSVLPNKIVGAKAILLYNTKTRKIGIYYSKTDEGLSIKGTTIQNYNEENSLQKTLRKPEIQIDQFRKAIQRRAEVVFADYIKAKAKPLNGRINDHTLIIQAWK